MKPILKSLLLALLSTVLLSCETEELESVIELMPIAEGNFWDYEYHNHSYGFKDSITLSIGKKMSILGYEGYLTGGNALIRSDEKGNTLSVLYFSELDTIILESAIYRQDIGLKESYEYHTIIMSSYSDGRTEIREDTITMTCTTIDTLIYTPAGDFKCFILENSPDNGGNIFKTYLSPGVGRIKTERFEDGKLFSSNTLYRFMVM